MGGADSRHLLAKHLGYSEQPQDEVVAITSMDYLLMEKWSCRELVE